MNKELELDLVKPRFIGADGTQTGLFDWCAAAAKAGPEQWMNSLFFELARLWISSFFHELPAPSGRGQNGTIN